jgi:hypothetical protein
MRASLRFADRRPAMKRKSTIFVTDVTFKKEIKIIHSNLRTVSNKLQKTDVSINRLDKKIDTSVGRLDASVERLDKKIDISVERLDASIERLDEKIDVSVERLDKKIDTSVERLALAIVKTQDDLAEVKKDMATKSDIDRVLNQIADFSKETALVLQNQEIHRGYIHDHEARLLALEKRPAS